ncbi:MAG: hypothetical protein A3G37_00630 [Omnitrophica WOR_2 bacterium RIFCSPLOWO2_12_FULL_46_30]|nr:MAG: hypothetical protein A3D27_02875 [Omnitrophica WOR_2 bacterium RIFCSPHIGHO2_02_FULL_46_37]OGX43871.1 MAG: hypothetical protein A3H41_04575 [Omnitrophica WOR_2 bacterium RIFCSPLOWO2_02_FULL_45_28]OGX51279.1 MAG: hypothetical protein A3G37_00630 [Omnitrophica WOR_2 bacterium RIFCSPLOWO2_12_FULL_46_30]
MGKTKPPPAAKLIIGLIYKQNAVKDKVLDILKRRFGEIDFLSRELDFDYTDYYYPELGRPLKRIFLSFKQLLSEDKLSEIKLYTNKLEERSSRKQKRQINIDPGFLSSGKLILATTKDYSHRVYLGKGIFAEATLFYKDAAFRPWPWTYPDYQSKEYADIFNIIRRLLPGERAENVS